MTIDGKRQEDFAAHLKQWCPRVEQALQTIPPFNPVWEAVAYDQFEAMFKVKMAEQKTVPGLSLLPISGESS